MTRERKPLTIASIGDLIDIEPGVYFETVVALTGDAPPRATPLHVPYDEFGNFIGDDDDIPNDDHDWDEDDHDDD
jgi:hypothetical protein